MPFEKRCGASIHQDNNSKLVAINHKNVSPKQKQTLLYKNIITTRSQNICEKCLTTGSSSPEPIVETEATTNLFDVLEIIKSSVKKDISLLYGNSPSFDSLKDYNPKEWLDNRPQQLTSIIKNLCNISDISTSNDYLKVALIVEIIYGSWNPNLVLPLSFTENLITSKVTHSKQTVKKASKLAPAGSYQHISNWIQKESANEKVIPSHDVKAMFDNAQVVGKSWKLSPLSKMPCSVVTVHAHISLGGDSKLQWEERLKPKHWWFSKLELVENPSENLFKKFRDDFLTSRINNLKTEGNVVEKMCKRRRWLTEQKFCMSCGCENDKTYRVCRVCNGKLGTRDFTLETYSTHDSLTDVDMSDGVSIFDSVDAIPKCQDKKVDIVCGEPNMVNPNSYDTISRVLRSLGCRLGIKRYGFGNREWLFLEVDATIFKVVVELISKTYVCNGCKSSWFGKDKLQTHGCDTDNTETEMEFDWVVPIPGLLHIEMNACRAFIQWNWEVFVEFVAKEIGFVSQNALQFVYNSSDHHKTWRLCELLCLGFADELLTPYMKTPCGEYSVDGYWEWCHQEHAEGKLGKNYVYMQEMILDVLMGIMLLRVSVRRNHYEGIVTAMEKVSVLFYGRNHPIYEKVYANFVKLHMYLPKECKTLLQKVMATSISGKSDTCQGGDACLEEVNKKLKLWLQDTGVPNEEQWLKSMRLLEKLEILRNNLDKLLGTDEENGDKDQAKVPNKDIVFVRSSIRMADYFKRDTNTHEPIEEQQKLDEELIYFRETANSLKRASFQRFINSEDLEDDPRKANMVYITQKEREEASKICNMTKKNLAKSIEERLPVLNEEFTKEYKELVKGRRKEEYVKFYEKIVTKK